MKMVYISLRKASVEFPIYNASSRSMKNKMLNIATGGRLEKRAGNMLLVKSLQNISLDLKEGDRLGLIGHNGAGKTTLLRLLSRIYYPTQGEAIIKGKCVSLINISLGINHEETGRSNIKIRSAIMGIKPNRLKEKIEAIIEFSGLGNFIDMPFRTYSSGMQLRLAFATSTAIDPEILIMDEWLSTGDEDFKKRATERINELVQKTKILVLASHSEDLIRKNCNKVIWLEHGKIKMIGMTDEVCSAYFGK